MRWLAWDDLPKELQLPEVYPYWEELNKKRGYLVAKRIGDIAGSASLLLVLSPLMACVACIIKLDSEGPVMFRQERVTQYGRHFRIHKFRTMVENAEAIGPQVTSGEDSRITNVGSIIRRVRIDEVPQLIDVLKGDMTFVGTRPESPRYVSEYQPEWMATLLLPAGVTSEASIAYKDEDLLLSGSEDPDAIYVAQVLPQKMVYNLQGIRASALVYDVKTMLRTVFAVAKRG